jgi:uncharacterized protein
MIRRNITNILNEAVRDNPVIILTGARQTGKSTLIQDFIKKTHPALYVSLDDLSTLSAIKADPEGFIAGLDQNVALDEIQRVPDLLLAIKKHVDRNRQPGRFILSGSANVLFLPTISESLAGRAEILTLWPFSQGEIENRKESFIDHLYTSTLRFSGLPGISLSDVYKRIINGGFPEITQRESLQRKHAWFNSYITTILQKDIRDLSRIEGIHELPKLLSVLAFRAGSLLNYADVSKDIGIPQTTLKRYISLLETIFFVYHLSPWYSNIGKRFVKSPKTYILDSGLLSFLLDVDENTIGQSPFRGKIFENFVVMEIVKQLSWRTEKIHLYHFRTHTGKEVDIVLENRKKELIGIEIKSSSTVSHNDADGIRELAKLAGKRFHRGVILYTGDTVVPFAKNIHAVPLGALWS